MARGTIISKKIPCFIGRSDGGTYNPSGEFISFNNAIEKIERITHINTPPNWKLGIEVAGLYAVAMNVMAGDNVLNKQINVFINGAIRKQLHGVGASPATEGPLQGAFNLYALNVGDYLQFRYTGASPWTIMSDTRYNWLMLYRVGDAI